MYRALTALPPDTVSGRIKITEQGEIISQKFGILSIAERSLEVMLTGTLMARFSDFRTQLEPVERERYRARQKQASDRFREPIDSGVAAGIFTTPYPDDVRRSIIASCNAVAQWYSQDGPDSLDDLVEIVAYAAARHVTVVPEVDLPGHVQAALASAGAAEQ